MFREGVGYREQIPVEVHTALGPSGGPGGEGDERDVVAGGVDGRVRRVGGRAAQQVVGGVAAVRRDAQVGYLGLGEVVHGADVAQRVPHLGDLAHGPQLVRALLGQHGDGDRARLQHRQPAGGQPRCGRAAQQHPVAGNDAEVIGEHMGEPVHPGPQCAVRPCVAGRGVEHRPVVVGAVEQFGRGVEPFGVVQPRQVETELGPLVGRWQVLAGEGVDVGGSVQTGHGGSPPCLVGCLTGVVRVGIVVGSQGSVSCW